MPDPLDTNLPPSSSPTSAPVADPAPAPAADLPNPQDSVNEALSSPALSTPVVPAPAADPAPMPKLEPLAETPKVETVTTVESPAIAASGDDVPLSLVTPPASPTVTTTTTTTPAPVTDSVTPPTPVVTTTTTTTPPVPEEPAAIPPVSPLPPAPEGGFTPPPEKKKKGSKVILGVLGFFLMIGLVGFGYFYFTAGEVPQVAKVGTYWKWLEQSQKRDQNDQINANSQQAQRGGYAGGGVGPNSNLGQGNYEGIAQANRLAAETGVSAAAYLAAAKKMEDGVATAAEKKIIADLAAKLLIDAAAAKAKQAAIAAGQASYTQANCASISGNANCTGDLCIDSGGHWVGDNCWMGSSATCEGPLTGIGGDPCAANGGICAGTDVIRCKCGNSWVGGRASAGCAGLCTGAGLTCGNNCEPPSEPSSPPSPSAPPETTLACDGITRAPTTTPVIGSALTFTCAGTLTPSTAGTITYDFRYSINDASPSAMTSTGATAQLTINACGTYKVQCRACATIDGVKGCDPIWTGATQ